MASINKVILVGHLGCDPEVRYSPEGAAICVLSLATTFTWKDKNSGEKREETEWHRVIMYHRLAEISGNYLKKGRLIYIEGRIKKRKWQDKDTGSDRYSTEIIAEQMQMLGTRESDVGSASGNYEETSHPRQQQRTSFHRPTPTNQRPLSSTSSDTKNLADMDDDIPF